MRSSHLIFIIFSVRLFILKTTSSFPTSNSNAIAENSIKLPASSSPDPNSNYRFPFVSSASLSKNVSPVSSSPKSSSSSFPPHVLFQPWKTFIKFYDTTSGRMQNTMEEAPRIALSSFMAKKPPRKRYPIHLNPFTRDPQFWLQTGECPLTPDGTREFFCPTPNASGMWACIDDYQLCDGVKSCPNSEDENPDLCLFYKAVENQLKLIANGVYINAKEDFNGGKYR